MNTILHHKNFQVYVLVLISLLITLGRQLDTGITNFDDAFYAQKAKEIYDSGKFWIVTLAGKPDFANPPLPFWLMALAYSIFGVSSFSAVFSSALLGTGIVILTYRLADHLYKDSWIAFTSSLVLVFPGIFIDSARRAMVDIHLAFFVTLAIFAFVKAKTNKTCYLVFGLSTAAAILSLIGLFNIFGSLLSGYLSSKMSKKIILSGIYFLRGISIILFIFTPASNLSAFLFGASFGFLWLSTVPATSGIVAHLFGTKYLGLLYGIVFVSHQVGSFLGAYLGGVFYEMHGNFDYAWYASIALSIFAGVIHLPIKEKTIERVQAA